MQLARTQPELIKQLRSIGLTVEQCKGSNHYKVRDKNGVKLFGISCSPSDKKNWFWNVKRDLRKFGLLEHFE